MGSWAKADRVVRSLSLDKMVDQFYISNRCCMYGMGPTVIL